MLTYRRLDQLQLIGCTNSEFVGCINNRKSILGYIFMIVGRWWF